MRLSAFIFLFAVAILIAISSLFVFLNISKFKSDIVTLDAKRYYVLATSLSDIAEQGLRFGLQLDQMDNLIASVDRLKSSHKDVKALAVLTETCAVVFGDATGLPDPKELCRIQARRAGAEVDGARYIFSEIDNSFDRRVGYVVATYPADLVATTIDRSTRDLVQVSALILGGACLVALICTVLLVRRAVAGFAWLTAALTGSSQAVGGEFGILLAERADAIRGLEIELSALETAIAGVA